MEELDLLDIYRKYHANTRTFTYETKNPKLKFRIDFFFLSYTVWVNVKRAVVCTSIVPDHIAIFLGIVLGSELERGPITLKCNNTLLNDETHVDLIWFLYPQILGKYKDVESKQLNHNGNLVQDYKLLLENRSWVEKDVRLPFKII